VERDPNINLGPGLRRDDELSTYSFISSRSPTTR
jgi:hypothetical protein